MKTNQFLGGSGHKRSDRDGKDSSLFGFGSGSCQVCKKRVQVRFGSLKNEGSSSVRVRFYSHL